jgi:hypothetical protein
MRKPNVVPRIRVAALAHRGELVEDGRPRIKMVQSVVHELAAQPTAILLNEHSGAKCSPLMPVAITRVAPRCSGLVHLAVRRIIIISGWGSLEQTSTFKSKKGDLRKQGYGPDVDDPLYALKGREEGHAPYYDEYPDEVAAGARPKS